MAIGAGAAAIAVSQSDTAQRMVKHTCQPTDYFADASGFAHNLAVDIAEKIRLVPLPHPH
jgi:hypothetical protein